jgi:SAM-dependent methyltransferase
MSDAARSALNVLARRMTPIDRGGYPELAGLSAQQIYEGKMGPGGLYLAAQMLRSVVAAEDMRVLDLGCGRGATSVFIARRLGARVISADLWISAAERQVLIEKHGAQGLVTPLDVDVRQPLPFAEKDFDLIFCMDAFHYFGARRHVVARLTRALKPGGRIVVGNPCFDREVQRPIPAVYQGPWAEEFSKYHSPPWWRDKLGSFDLFADVSAWEADDGQALWDDDLLFDLARGDDPVRLLADAREITFGRDHPGQPILTHLILCAVRGR